MTWAFQDAKAKLSEVIRRALTDGPQAVTVRGQPSVVVISEADLKALRQQKRRRPLAELFRHSPIAGEKLDLTRSRDAGRPVDL